VTWTWFHRLGSPPHFYRLAGRMVPWFAWPAAALLLLGAWWGLAWAPADYQQGDGFRIIYVHVPAAYLSTQTYVVMAVASAIGLIWRMKLAYAVAASCAPIGASFTFLALVTGSIWGKPMWGTWWEWDGRMTSVLVLFFLYLGYMALRASFEDLHKADRASSVLAIVGVINVPIIKYSVEWWNTLHQGPTIVRLGGPAITMNMLAPLLIMILAYILFFAAVLLGRTRSEILLRERQSRWVRRELEALGG
jgi:heme exporter protein C